MLCRLPLHLGRKPKPAASSCITSFVRVECLTKPRKKTPTVAETELMRRLARSSGAEALLPTPAISATCRRSWLLESRKRLGKGTLVHRLAMKIEQQSSRTTRRPASSQRSLGTLTFVTTPHLFSWLIFRGGSDSDKRTVIAQHRAMDRPLAPHFEAAYEIALQCRLNAPP